MQHQLVKYEAACRAVAEARTIDEVKHIANAAEAARAYAKQAKNRQMEIDAVEIRTRAERRLGEIILQLKSQGHGVQGRTSVDRQPITLKELGIDHNISAGAQRMAMLPVERFEAEISDWRASAPNALRLQSPLQRYRHPSITADRQKAAFKAHRTTIDDRDAFGLFRGPDGRRIADWRVGELERLVGEAARYLRCAEALLAGLPGVVSDPLATVEMVFEQNELLVLLEQVWCGQRPPPQSDYGLRSAKEGRRCATCGDEFQPKSGLHLDRPNEGKYCSRVCAGKRQRDSSLSAA